MRRDDPGAARRRLVRTVVVVVLAVGAVVGGPWVYAQVVAPDAPPPLGVEVPTGSPTPTAAPSPTPLTVDGLEGTWRVARGSEAGYRIDEVLTGQDVTVVGRTSQVTGDLRIEGGRLVEARVEVDTGAIETDEAARDAYFRRALDTGTHPTATFVLDEPVDVASLVEGGEVGVTARGTLTLHGVSAPVTAELQARSTRQGVVVAGQVPVRLDDFDLVAPDLGFVTVERTGAVEMRLVLAR